MSTRILIRNATVVLPDQTAETNVLIENGVIAAVDAAADQPSDEVIEADGMLLLPGVIDDQVHFREPGLTHKEDIQSGSRACAAGGITTFLEMPNTNPTTTDSEALAKKIARGKEVSQVNFGFYVGATPHNLEFLKSAQGTPGIKIFIGSSTGDLLVDEQAALEGIFAETSLPICAHCEDETTVRNNRKKLEESGALVLADHSRIRDVNAAVIATNRAIDLAERHKHRFHVLHVSTGDEVPLILPAKPYLTAEACPHHFLFSTEDYDRLGTLVQMNPSVKGPEHPPVIWQGLIDGDIQVIATDHAPHTLEEKDAQYPASPSGLPAVENSLSLMLNLASQGKCTYQQIASWMSDAPARVWGIVGKGRIAPGYDADLVLVEPNRKHLVENEKQWTKSKWSPWHGVELTGYVNRTIVGGKTVYKDGQLMEANGNLPTFDHERGGYWATPDGIGLS